MIGDLTKEQGLDKILVEGGKMTEEELMEKIVNKLLDYYDGCPFCDTKRYADQILALIREAGWRAPEEDIVCPFCGDRFSMW